MIKNKFLWLLFASITLFGTLEAQQPKTQQAHNAAAVGKIWDIEKANAWYKNHKWITGADYLPATAINQLEM